MFEHRDPTGSSFISYELDANDFDYFEGETLAPGGEIGIDIRTGCPVYLDWWGKVATAYYNPMNHSYLVMLTSLSPNRRAGRELDGQIFATV